MELHVKDSLQHLLASQDQQTKTAEQLTARHSQLMAAIEDYRQAWKASVGAGWSTSELTAAGLTNPTRLPRLPRQRRSNSSDNSPSQD